LPSHNSTPQSIPVTVSANRGGLVGINVTVFPLAAGCGGSSMQFDLYFDEQNAAHRLLSQSFAPGAAQTVLTANAYVGKKATSSSHNVIMTLSDNCPPNPMSGTLGSVNAQVDLVEFAP
jgi:hypothetical protein